jgi:hypothetical protein
MARSARNCPNCGATVTPFAAGCAVCGTDLEAWRKQQAARTRVPSMRLPTVDLGAPAFLTGRDSALIAVLWLLALLSPILCVILAIFGARERHLEGRETARNIVAALGALAVLTLFVPALRYGLLGYVFS